MRTAIVSTALLVALAGTGIVGPAAEEPKMPEVMELEDVSFPHQMHLDDFGIECRECHHETDAAKLESPHQEYFADFWINCQICHHESRTPRTSQRCSHCHHDTPFDIADETRSAKVVIHQKCWSCHEVGAGAEASATCATCHSSRPPAKKSDGGNAATNSP